MQKHILKTDPAVFQAVIDGAKTYEIRFNDRGFAVGDELLLRETTRTGAEIAAGAALEYTGREVTKRVGHVLTGYGLVDGWAILSFAAPVSAGTIDTPIQRYENKVVDFESCEVLPDESGPWVKYADHLQHTAAAVAEAEEQAGYKAQLEAQDRITDLIASLQDANTEFAKLRAATAPVSAVPEDPNWMGKIPHAFQAGAPVSAAEDSDLRQTQAETAGGQELPALTGARSTRRKPPMHCTGCHTVKQIGSSTCAACGGNSFSYGLLYGTKRAGKEA